MLPLAAQIDLELRKYVKSDKYNIWLITPNTELSFRTPSELFRKHQFQPLWNLICRLERQNTDVPMASA